MFPGERMNVDIAETIQQDGKAINRLLLARRIDAATAPRLTAVCAQTMILYGLRRSRAVPVKTIAQLLPDISTALSAVRRRRVQVRLSADGLALEVPHPQPAPQPIHQRFILPRKKYLQNRFVLRKK